MIRKIETPRLLQLGWTHSSYFLISTLGKPTTVHRLICVILSSRGLSAGIKILDIKPNTIDSWTVQTITGNNAQTKRVKLPQK